MGRDKVKAAAYGKIYRAEHKEHLRELNRAYNARLKEEGRSYYSRDPEGNRKRNAAWREFNKDRILARNREYYYGITAKEFDDMLVKQQGRCAVCSIPFTEERKSLIPCVDHDHNTGRVRGLLCSHCNRGLGSFRDDPETLEAGAAYLRAAVRAELKTLPGAES
jgi:5-methylcytosine-specific restriction endonuclease McrA